MTHSPAPSSAAPRSATDRDFTVFWFGQTLSELGNAFALVALPLLVLHATGSVAQMGLLTAVAGAASIVTGVFAGSVVDRLDRRRLMIGCDLARMALFGLIPVVWAVSPQVWLLFVVMAFNSVFEMTFRIAYVTAVASLVDADRLVAANGRLETTNAVAFIAGPVLAGAVSGWWGPTVAIAVNAGSFAVSALALAAIRLRRGQPAPAPDAGSVREGFLVGFRFLWRTPVLRAVTLLLTMISFVSLGLIDVVIYHLRTGLGGTDGVVGLALGAAGAGTVVAAVLVPGLRRRLGFGPCWLGSYVLCGISVALLGLSGSVPAVAVLVLLYTVGMGVAGICSMSLRQAITPDHLLGRVTSAFWTLHTALAPLGAAALTALVGAVGVRGPLLAVGGVFLAVVVIGLATPIRRRFPEHGQEILRR
ncbi:MAG TPA: MFS transporter [Actinophytocola sp.]|uniref:MFS transporter n=1 Tax=Actinophytocola sp. TaxID=1872138 RepID=UPI002DBEFA77|nr:MFS transporter [Actinophytocola sp.]HEU5470691.1 MFS transporter [Actinophytocola sp.]